MVDFNDSEGVSGSLLDANQLPPEEQMVNADEALAQKIESTLLEEEVNDSAGVLSSNLIHDIQTKFDAANRARDTDENRWLEAYQNYRGYYAKNIKFSENEKSRVFIKVTKTKVLAAYGQLLDVLFGTEKFPISVTSTKVPEGAQEYVHFKVDGAPTTEAGPSMQAMEPIPQEVNPYDVGYAGDGMNVPAGAKLKDVTIGIKKDLLGPNKENVEKFQAGPSKAGEPQLKPAHDASKRMEKLIHDQIEESDGAQELRSAIFESCLLGTGIIKGPFTYEKTLHRWSYDPETKQRNYKPQKVKVPRIEFCSLFDAFPDPNAVDMSEAEWFIQRHKFSRSQIRGLKDRPFFDSGKINDVLNMSPNYVRKDYENDLIAENGSNFPNQDRYEVLEYWGVMDAKTLEDAGVTLSGENNLDEVQVNAWVCAGKLLRIVLNPFTPKRIPYLAFDYERNPYSFFGIGVAENMSDSQQVMNGHMRMAIDNLALAGHMVFDIDENALVPGQTMEIFPGKVFKRQSGMPGQAIFGLKFPNTAPENMQIFDKFRQIADESTGIPSFAHGQTGIMSTTRTAAGMSMLMGAASLAVKTVVKNIDDFLLKPLGEAMFQWNMSFYEGDLDIVGDMEVNAGGASSLMQNEIRSQRLTAFGQLFANPAIAPFIKIPAYVKAFVESLELDPNELVNNPEEAAMYAAIMGAAGGVQGGATPQAGSMGGGQVGGVPAPAMPGGEGFSANTGQMAESA